MRIELLTRPWPSYFNTRLGALVGEMAEAGSDDVAMTFLKDGQPVCAVIVLTSDPATVRAYMDAVTAVGDRVQIGPTDV
ncbi:hypothetical protein [Pigmentiphaga kullae]|uniref:Uncharacterized protein n=1 Tax=Pigmentiphaga kullae TaxID=151784 RepID=A0A4Q7NNC0_9BURK|nr:hypothetical protein [Pigmentiphaga kullae]RZS86040.1 hypothetical protein EV675_2074 [Pigmentiphaga kullae]